jgi:glycine betaine/proline transport system substrate-binding protein
MIREDALGLGGFQLVESSEQGMLAEVERAVQTQRPIVFLGWSPHPMNTRFSIRYLTGGDAWFGPDFGGATVHTVTRRGYLQACPNAGRLLANVEFTVDDENALMEAILHGRQAPDAAADAWMAAHPDRVSAWLRGVTRLTGDSTGSPPSPVSASRTGTSAFEAAMTRHKLPVGDLATRGVEYAKRHAQGAFGLVSSAMERAVRLVEWGLYAVPAPLLIGLAALLAWTRRRSFTLVVFVTLALLFIMNQGYWAATIETLTLVLVAAALATMLGIPIGILTARRPALHAWLRPVLDLMQTLPTFVYLTPTLVLFGLGVVPGLVATVIFALPAPIRLTHLGISGVPRPLVEAGHAFGATPWQLLWKVELPSAKTTIMAGVTQCIMLSLSMVVIAALVGAGGLGVPVVRALNTVQVGTGIEAGLAIVLVAIILDRLARPGERAGRG